MNPQKTASGSGNSATATGHQGAGSAPFDEIIALEKKEQERVATELQVFEKEMVKKRQEYAEKKQQQEVELKQKAKEELKTYREEELSKILSDADEKALAVTKKLDEQFGSKSHDLAKELVQQIVSDHSLLQG